jgi:hypothetical protein
MSLDPRPAKPVATAKSMPEANALLVWGLTADMTPDLVELIVENVALRVIQKMDEREAERANRALQSLP